MLGLSCGYRSFARMQAKRRRASRFNRIATDMTPCRAEASCGNYHTDGLTLEFNGWRLRYAATGRKENENAII
jgi:hypothetical protein